MAVSRKASRSGDHPRGCGEQSPPQWPPLSSPEPSPRVRGADVPVRLRDLVAGTIPAGAGSSLRPPRGAHRRRDHPRGCGEQTLVIDQAQYWAGPSPRVRGAGLQRVRRRPVEGTIPAGAGSSRPRGRARRICRDHPRGCGEQVSYLASWALGQGPSPRVRGAVGAGPPEVPVVGTIPAGAGSSDSRPIPRCRRGDHPRGCGEQREASLASWSSRGPSPRVRGAGEHPPGAHPAAGTIPAGAGSRIVAAGCTSCTRDHPRGCGEQSSPLSTAMLAGGPSPRVRGAGFSAGVPVRRGGTIPAGAGSSRLPRSRCAARRDHPRGCGEQTRRRASPGRWRGPSPRVRGADVGRRRVDGDPGTIPAGAGSSAIGGPPAWGPRDHPRGCGEQLVEVSGSARTLGPSPRVRGAERREALGQLEVGTIPAGAGSRAPSPKRSTWRRDHPRGCGEQAAAATGSRRAAGPSPRVRGAEGRGAGRRRGVGTIPAGAGSSSSGISGSMSHRDHPRGCGEQREAPLLWRWSTGTIPAGAGSRLAELGV